MLNLTCNVTLEGLSTKDWVKEVHHHSKGLRSHAEISNRLLHEWLDSDHRPMLSKVNIVTMDFVHEDICQKVISLNQK